MWHIIKSKTKKKKHKKMTTAQKLLTNTTNRFHPTIPIILSNCQSSFTSFPILSSDPESIQAKAALSISNGLLQSIPQTYSQLQEKYNDLTKQVKEATNQKELMTMLFQKVFLIEAGKQEKMKKRFRRKKTQIQSKHSCTICSKVYSSSTSLARHSKLKHSYTMLQPPQHDYQIPPQPNSINDPDDHSKPDNTQLNLRDQKKAMFINEQDDSQSLQSCSSEQNSSDSSSHQLTPFQKGLS